MDVKLGAFSKPGEQPPERVKPLAMSTEIPKAIHDREYSKHECLLLALDHYHAELQQHLKDQTHKKPVILRLANTYGVPETTLRRHIKNPGQRNIYQAHVEQQALTVEEEKILVEKILSLDDSGAPADKAVLYSMAHDILRQREPERVLGRDWIYRFVARHSEIRYVIVNAIAADRENAVSWGATMTDYIVLIDV